MKCSRSAVIEQKLRRVFPNPKPFLNYKTPYQLLVAAILSAQCTDARVNFVTQQLFRDCPGPKEIAALGVKKLISYIRSCGFFNTKARHIMASTALLLKKFHEEIPRDFEILKTFPGVGEKTAGVILSQAFQTPAFPVDTHVFRVARRLGLSKARTPNQVSRDLQKKFSKKTWINLHLRFILLGRNFCTARNPNHKDCPLLSVCPTGKKQLQI